MKKIFLILLIAASIFTGCNSTYIEKDAEGNEILHYKTAWGDKETMLINPEVERHDYDFTKLKFKKKRFIYDDERYEIKHGIDVSSHEKDIDWKLVKEDGVEFAFLRIAFRRYGETGKLELDQNFHANLKGALENGIPVGVYVFSQAINEEEALEEAQIIIDNVKPQQLELPVVFDPESIRWDESRTDDVTGEQFTKNTIAFCAKMKKAGYKTMIYANMTWENKFFDLVQLKDEPIWFADYVKIPQTPYKFTFWQYSCTGTIKGIPERKKSVDLDVWFVTKENPAR
ncbi:MAG: glycoside hydrolase family 25 protein [Treponema sp.]|nr:glycoside hydrolase family 25 protein [Treponema sp.]